MRTISVVVPAFNEGEAVSYAYSAISSTLQEGTPRLAR